MPLPPPAPRQHLHTRTAVYRGFLRDDGLWDIEAEMSDVKTYAWHLADKGEMEPGDAVHGMSIRLTVDESLTIREVATSMDFTPYGECQQGIDPMQKMVGVQMGRGWRQAIEQALGGIGGCTHLRELLFNMATAAYQTTFPYREHVLQRAGARPTDKTVPPSHLGRCIAWDFDGTVVQRVYPQFHRKAPGRLAPAGAGEPAAAAAPDAAQTRP